MACGERRGGRRGQRAEEKSRDVEPWNSVWNLVRGANNTQTSRCEVMGSVS